MIERWQPRTDAPAEPAAPPTPQQLARRRKYAKTLCQNALNPTSLALANKLIRTWFDCDCEELLNEGTNPTRNGLSDRGDVSVIGGSMADGNQGRNQG